MPGSHPLLGQMLLPVLQHHAAVWPALEKLGFETQLLIIKFAYWSEMYQCPAEVERRFLSKNRSTLLLALLDGADIYFLLPYIRVIPRACFPPPAPGPLRPPCFSMNKW